MTFAETIAHAAPACRRGSVDRSPPGRRTGWVALLTALAVPLASVGGTSAEEPPAVDPDTIRQEHPTFLVGIDVDRPDRRYREGDQLSVRVRTERDAHVHVLYRQADGQVFQIFPNDAQPDNRVKAGADVVIPAPGDTFRWIVGPPLGRETIKVIAAERPIEPLSAPDLFAGRFNTVPPERLAATKGVLVEPETGPWAEAQIEIITEKRPDPPPQKRVGLFVGVSRFRYDAVHTARAGKAMALPCSAVDARFMADTFVDRCGVTESLVLVDEEATRDRFRNAVCDWLPARTNPGDVVMIFASTHGSQVFDRNKDEPDQFDESLVLNDTATLAAFVEMVERQRQGTLDAAMRPVVDRLMSSLGAEANANRIDPEDARQVEAFLAEQTAVTDDQLGHWLQRLSGRRVVVFLCTCHSGGFSVGEKGVAPAADQPFDFLDREMGRLKDLGQSDMSLIAACLSAETTAAVRFSDEALAAAQTKLADQGGTLKLGPTTYELGKAVEVPGLMLHQAYERYRSGLTAYFEKFNAVRVQQGESPVTPHHPVMYDFSLEPLVLSVERRTN